jgi:hypothetical protein
MEEFVNDGGAKDYAEYREAVGVIKGLLQAFFMFIPHSLTALLI